VNIIKHCKDSEGNDYITILGTHWPDGTINLFLILTVGVVVTLLCIDAEGLRQSIAYGVLSCLAVIVVIVGTFGS